MAWIALDPAGEGLGVDERPPQVMEALEDNFSGWLELHDRGLPVFVEARMIYYIEPDVEERAATINEEATTV